MCKVRWEAPAIHVLYECDTADTFRPEAARHTILNDERDDYPLFTTLKENEVLPGYTTSQLWTFSTSLLPFSPLFSPAYDRIEVTLDDLEPDYHGIDDPQEREDT